MTKRNAAVLRGALAACWLICEGTALYLFGGGSIAARLGTAALVLVLTYLAWDFILAVREACRPDTHTLFTDPDAVPGYLEVAGMLEMDLTDEEKDALIKMEEDDGGGEEPEACMPSLLNIAFLLFCGIIIDVLVGSTMVFSRTFPVFVKDVPKEWILEPFLLTGLPLGVQAIIREAETDEGPDSSRILPQNALIVVMTAVFFLRLPVIFLVEAALLHIVCLFTAAKRETSIEGRTDLQLAALSIAMLWGVFFWLLMTAGGLSFPADGAGSILAYGPSRLALIGGNAYFTASMLALGACVLYRGWCSREGLVYACALSFLAFKAVVKIGTLLMAFPVEWGLASASLPSLLAEAAALGLLLRCLADGAGISDAICRAVSAGTLIDVSGGFHLLDEAGRNPSVLLCPVRVAEAPEGRDGMRYVLNRSPEAPYAVLWESGRQGEVCIITFDADTGLWYPVCDADLREAILWEYIRENAPGCMDVDMARGQRRCGADSRKLNIT